MPPALPVPITPLGPATAATLAFRSRGRLHLTAILKATFALAAEARMAPLAPDPITPDEIPDPAGRGLRAAGDLAPYLGQTDVLLTGHAEILPTFTAPELRIWLALVRDRAIQIDRWLELDTSARVGPNRAHLRIDGAGPLSRTWPRRSQLLGTVDPRRLKGPILDIPEGFDWSYFQAAPAEQRMELLRGDEWLVLGGVFAQRPKLRTQLPDVRAVARLYRRTQAAPRTGTPIQLVADTLQIDADRRCASIVWRGHVPVEEAELASLHVVAGLEVPGRALAWVDPFPPEQPTRRAPSAPEIRRAPSAPEISLSGTMALTEHETAKLAAKPSTIFEKPRASAPEAENPLEGTMALPGHVALKLAEAPATPFKKPAASMPAPENPLTGTMAVPVHLARKLMEAPATPFEKPRAPSLEADNPLAGTFMLPADAARKLAEAPATPFERREEGIAAPRRVDVEEVFAVAVSTSAGEEVIPPSEVTPEAFPVEVERPAPLFALEAVSVAPKGLGAAFLAAMEAAGELG